jgi:hypothetical protein
MTNSLLATYSLLNIKFDGHPVQQSIIFPHNFNDIPDNATYFYIHEL